MSINPTLLTLTTITNDQWKANRGKLIAYAKKLGASNSDAEDLAQETFTRLFRNKPEFPNEASFYTWLKQTLLRIWIDQKRANQVRFNHALQVHRITEDNMTASIEAPDAQIEWQEMMSLCREVMTDREWIVFDKCLLAGKTFQKFLETYFEGMQHNQIKGPWQAAYTSCRKKSNYLYNFLTSSDKPISELKELLRDKKFKEGFITTQSLFEDEEDMESENMEFDANSFLNDFFM